jgi:hypothetical protein
LRETVLGLLDRMLPTEPVLLPEQIPPVSPPSDGIHAVFTTSL